MFDDTQREIMSGCCLRFTKPSEDWQQIFTVGIIVLAGKKQTILDSG
jgi:hypothetical protein